MGRQSIQMERPLGADTDDKNATDRGREQHFDTSCRSGKTDPIIFDHRQQSDAEACRQTKAKARIEAFYKLEKATKPRPRDASLAIQADGSERRLGGKILQLRNVSLKFGDRVMLSDFSYHFCSGDRICLVGSNGVGKTTFLKVLTGELPFDSGTIDTGETVVMGVYDQLGLQLGEEEQKKMTVLDFVLENVQAQQGTSDGTMPQDEARRLLKQFEFPRKRWNDRVSMLSGGEKRRLQLLEIITKRPNVMLMDEPS